MMHHDEKSRSGTRKSVWKQWGWWLVIPCLLTGLAFLLGRGIHASRAESVSPLENRPACMALASAPYRFVAIGDWGAGTQFQRDIADQLIRQHRKAPFDALLTLGDNIYEDGNIKKYGKAYFTDMYRPLIEGGVQFLVSLGNHDIRGGYKEDQKAFFKMPGDYYTVSGRNVDFFAIESNRFAEDEVQQRWLDEALAKSKAEWKIVFGHHPVYSSGLHGNTAGLIRTLEPLLAKHKVDFYLAGHDHDYERFAKIKGIQYIVSGGGGAYLRGFKKPSLHSRLRLEAHHFLSFELKDGVIRLEVVDKTGKVIDQAQWTKSKTTAIPKAS